MRTRFLVLAVVVAGEAMGADSLPAAKQQVRTAAKTDVQVQVVDQAGTTLLNVQSNNTAAGAGGAIQELSGLVNSTLPTYTAGNIAMPSIDTAGRTYVTTDAAATLRSNIVQIAGSAPSASNPMPSQLTDGAAAYVAAKTGQLPSALGQTTKSASVSVTLASDQGSLSTTPGAPTGATNAFGTQTSISAGSTTAIACASSLATTTPMKLYRVRVSAAALGRCIVRYNNNGGLTNWLNLMTSAAKPSDEAVLPSGFVGLTTGASGTQAIEASCTNFDAAAQDFNVDCSYCIGASGC